MQAQIGISELDQREREAQELHELERFVREGGREREREGGREGEREGGRKEKKEREEKECLHLPFFTCF